MDLTHPEIHFIQTWFNMFNITLNKQGQFKWQELNSGSELHREWKVISINCNRGDASLLWNESGLGLMAFQYFCGTVNSQTMLLQQGLIEIVWASANQIFKKY